MSATGTAHADDAAVMARLGQAMAGAARERLGRPTLSVDQHVMFLRPASEPLAASGRATGGGRSICFCEAELTNAQGEVVARAMGSFRVAPAS